MKKILFVVHNLIIGGVEKVCWEIVNQINKNKYHIDFLVAIDKNVIQYYEPLLLEKGCKIYKGGFILDSKSRNCFLEYEKKLLQKEHYDVVHAHMDFMNSRVLCVAKKWGVRNRISHVHTTEVTINNSSFIQTALSKLKYKFLQFLMRYYSTKMLGCSRSACNCFYGTGKGDVLFNGIDIHKYLNIQKLDDAEFQFITIGRIDKQKNPFFIIDIMKSLVKIDSKYKLFWIGNGQLYEQVRKRIIAYGLEENIDLIGATTDIMAYMEKSRYSLFPSLSEGLGIALVETQLSGIFTFYSDIIPQEANIGYAIPFSLSPTADEWAEKINLFIKNKGNEKYRLDESRYNLFDITCTVAELCNYYDGKN